MRSPLSNKLSGVVFSPQIDGESKPPSQQGKITKEELRRKEKIVFDNAINQLQQHWANSSFDDLPISVTPVLCGENPLLWDDYDYVKEYLSCPLNSIHKFADLTKEFKAILMQLHLSDVVTELVVQNGDHKKSNFT